MKTMEVKDYKEAYLTLMIDMKYLDSPVRDVSKYIEKMVMIGKKYKRLEIDIRHDLQHPEENTQNDVVKIYETEFQVLEFMVETTITRLNNNRSLSEGLRTGDCDLQNLVHDFNYVRLTVKSRAMGAKAEMQELLLRLNRHRTLLLVK